MAINTLQCATCKHSKKHGNQLLYCTISNTHTPTIEDGCKFYESNYIRTITTNQMPTNNYCQTIPLTKEELYEMYSKLEKDQLIEMLVQRDILGLGIPTIEPLGNITSYSYSTKLGEK